MFTEFSLNCEKEMVSALYTVTNKRENDGAMVRCAEAADASGTVEILTDTKAVPCYERHDDIKLS